MTEMSFEESQEYEATMVTCKHCGTESELGTTNCPSCNKFLKGGKGLGKEGGKARAENKDSAKRLLLDYDLKWDDVTETLRIMAKRAVNGTTNDMRAFLQQIEELTPAKRSTGGESEGASAPDLVLTGETVDEINKSMKQLNKITQELIDAEEELDAE